MSLTYAFVLRPVVNIMWSYPMILSSGESMHRFDIRSLGRFVKRRIMGRFVGVGGGGGDGGFESRYVCGCKCRDLGWIWRMEEEIVDPFAINRYPALPGLIFAGGVERSGLGFGLDKCTLLYIA